MKILTEFKQGRITLDEICKKHGVRLERFFLWLYLYYRWSRAEFMVLRALRREYARLRRENARLRQTIREIQTPSRN